MNDKKIISSWCLKHPDNLDHEDHRWCANRDYEECHCECECHQIRAEELKDRRRIQAFNETIERLERYVQEWVASETVGSQDPPKIVTIAGQDFRYKGTEEDGKTLIYEPIVYQVTIQLKDA